MELDVLKLFFPEELVSHFEITGGAIKQGKHRDYLEVEFTERNELPEGYSREEYEAKDFVEKTIQKARIDQRWKEIDRENKSILQARKAGKSFKLKVFSNGDTPKQPLARSRYILYKLPHQWTENQIVRAATLFKAYPDIEKAYKLHLEFRVIYEGKDRSRAENELMNWIQKVQKSENEYFQSVAESLLNHWSNILNFFNNRSTNAHAESLNAQIKLFRANLRGVTDTKYFLYRLQKIFA